MVQDLPAPAHSTPPVPSATSPAARLAALYRTGLLDTPPEAAFDRLTRLAARLLGAPIALVSLVDEERQFLKSAVGFPAPWASARSMPLSHGFDPRVVQSGEPLAVGDTRQDPVTRYNPVVREMGWLAYAGVPLVTGEGHVLGVMSVIDTMPRLWSERDVELLRDLAASVVTEIELRSLARHSDLLARHAEPEGTQGEGSTGMRADPSVAPLPQDDEPGEAHAGTDMFEATALGMAELSLDGRWRRVNRALCGMLGYARETLVGQPVEAVTYPDDITAEREAMRLILAGESPAYQVEKRYLHGAGGVVWALLTVSLVHGPDGAPDHFLAGIQDITDWKLAAAAEAAPAEGEAAGGTAQPGDATLEAGDAGRPGGEPEGAGSVTEPTRGVAEGHPAAVPPDAETLRRREDQLRHAQKMEAVAQLAGGVARDFNNLLTGILSYCDLILQELRPNDPIRGDVEQIRQTGQRAAGVTRQLLAFSRRQVLQPRVLSLNSVVAELDLVLRRRLGPDVALETELDPGLWQVRADPAQLEQVLMNLVANARDAMPDRGRLTITTANVRLDADAAARTGRIPAGDYVALTVRDTGIGMDPGTQARIFDPFFTTKAPGKGSGLGLSMVYGIVEQSGGRIAVTSAPRQGATFTIYLPRYVGQGATAVREDRRALPRGTETLLLVEDEPAVRDSVRRLLERHGYTVLEARHGAEALRIFEANEAGIDLVLTDVVMPEIGGRELVERLRTRRPTLKVLFMSGYTEKAIAPDGIMPPGTGFVEKPFTLEALIRRVREVLDG